MTVIRWIALTTGAASTLLLSACVGPAQAPALAPAARPLPPPTPRPIVPADWHDMPATPGVWQWFRTGRSSVARFGDPALFTLTCNPLAGTVSLARGGGAGSAATMAILTTSVTRTLAIRPGTIRPGGDGTLTAVVAARDPLLDAMAYSRGRFAVKVPGMTGLYLPSWPEVGRVIEDCR